MWWSAQEDENPLDMFNGTVQLIDDVDGDGRLEVVSGRKRAADIWGCDDIV